MMKLKTSNGADAMQLDAIERSGNTFILKARVLGTMPMNVVLTPEAMREGIKMLGWGLLPFALTFLFRSSSK
jgi:hypothetical protein